jgi:hypothetical protein
VSALHIASRTDLDDLNGTTADGLHLAAMGGLWHALAFGFLGLRPRAGVLHLDPRNPTALDRAGTSGALPREPTRGSMRTGLAVGACRCRCRDLCRR